MINKTEIVRHIIYGVILTPIFYIGLYGCMAMVEPANQYVIEWKSE